MFEILFVFFLYFDELECFKTFNDKGNSYFTNVLASGL